MDKDQLIKDLIRDEGVRSFPYRDSLGKLTIGVGRNLDNVGLHEDEITYLLGNDVDSVVTSLNQMLPWWANLSEPRQRVIANMAFNMGVTKLLDFKNMLGFLKAGDYDNAAQEMLNSRWAKQVGQRSNRLASVMKAG